MKNKIIAFLTPAIVVAQIIFAGQIMKLISAPNDIEVAIGVLTLCAFLAINYYMVRYYVRLIKSINLKNKKEDEKV